MGSLIILIIFLSIKVGFNIFPYEYAHLVIQDSTIHLLSFMDVNIFEIIQASAIFLFIKNLYHFNLSIPGEKFIKKGILSISKASYGIYLIHGLFILVITELLANIPFSGTEICILIVILTILVLAISWICILLTTKIPIVRKLSGYH
jgi:peptidoglycan/LPS O-acetylase OafA/YrhL